jgi:hypothetical protein
MTLIIRVARVIIKPVFKYSIDDRVTVWFLVDSAVIRLATEPGKVKLPARVVALVSVSQESCRFEKWGTSAIVARFINGQGNLPVDTPFRVMMMTNPELILMIKDKQNHPVECGCEAVASSPFEAAALINR